MTLSIDGHANGLFTAAASGTVTLTTTTAADLIVVLVASENNSATVPAVSSVTATGLTFTRLPAASLGGTTLRNDLSPGLGTNFDVFAATASGILTAEVITVTMTGTIDDCSLVAFGIKGNVPAVDTNGSAIINKTSATAAQASVTATGLSTNAANTMLLGLLGTYNGSGGDTLPMAVNTGAGWAAIDNKLNSGGANASFTQAAFLDVSSQQSGATLTPYTGTVEDYYFFGVAIYESGGGGGASQQPFTPWQQLAPMVAQ